MKHYVAGPMSFVPQFNFPAFFAARDALTKLGLEVILPADMEDPKAVELAMSSPDGKPGGVEGLETWGQCLAKDVELIADHVGGIVFLPGWEKSRGAKLEAFTALLCNHEFRCFDPYSNDVIQVSRDYIVHQLHMEMIK